LVPLAGSLWVATDTGPLLQRIDPAAGEITATFRVSDQGSINANQLIGIGDGALWFPLLDAGTVVKVAIPAEASPAASAPTPSAVSPPVVSSSSPSPVGASPSAPVPSPSSS